MESPQAVDALSALAHATRLAVFRLLIKAGGEGVPAGEIARALEILPNTLSSHLTILSHADLISSRRDGRLVYYVADYGQMRTLIAFLLEDCCQGAPEICAPIMSLMQACD
jgi:DNA-binding transcriptional ArsR family regulator